VSGRTYSLVSATSFPTSDGMEPVMELPSSHLPKPSPTSAPRLAGAGWKVKWSMYVQILHVHHVPNLRRDGAGDGVVGQGPAKHPPTSAPRLVGAGRRLRVRSMYVQYRQCHQLPNLRRDGAGDGVAVQHPAKTPTHVSTTSGGSWVEGACVVARTVSSVPPAARWSLESCRLSWVIRYPGPCITPNRPAAQFGERVTGSHTLPKRGLATHSWVQVAGVARQAVKVESFSSFTPPTSITLPESSIIANNARKIDGGFVEAPIIVCRPPAAPART
jgi:hypothetical protein